jgi:DNA ligase-1
MIITTLFKKTSAGKVQQWSIELEDDKYRVISGQLNGKMVTSKWKTAKPTNTGKANGRNGAQQAIFEVNAKIKKQGDDGYLGSIQEAEEAEFKFSPTLAKEYKNYAHKICYPCYTQPKFDGVRSCINIAGMWSRDANEQLSAPHIHRILKPMFDIFPTMVLDGELYNHDLKQDFDKIISLAKKGKPTPEDIQESEKMLHFYVFDVFFGDTTEMTFAERRKALIGLIEGLHDSIRIVPTFLIRDEEHLHAAYAVFNLQGYEGQIIRLNDTAYECRRTPNLLKRKEYIDEEFKIINVLEGVGNRSEMAGMVQCIMGNKKVFKAGLKGGVAKYQYMWEHRSEYIGKVATVRYQNLTPKGKPRFPVMRAVRDYE